jgi:hypothetical protein
MYYFNFLKKSRTYVPSYKYDFIRFSFNSVIFGFCLETYLILKGRYNEIYASAYKKELMKVKEHDERMTDSKRKKMLLNQKRIEIDVLEKKIEKLENNKI